MEDVLDPEARRKIMFDDSTLELSEFYFTLLQTLRIASEWINETSRDLAHLVARIDHPHFSSSDTPVSFLSGAAEMKQAQKKSTGRIGKVASPIIKANAPGSWIASLESKKRLRVFGTG